MMPRASQASLSAWRQSPTSASLCSYRRGTSGGARSSRDCPSSEADSVRSV